MPIDHEADRAQMFKEAGVAVTSGSSSGFGVVRVADAVILEQHGCHDFIGRAYVVTLRTADFPSIRNKDAITVNGQARTILRKLVAADGGIVRVLCSAAA